MKLKILSIMLIILAVLMPVVLATPTIQEVKVNGIAMDSDKLYVQLGEKLDIDVTLKSVTVDEDLKLKAWIGGYDDSIEDSTELFDLDHSKRKMETLELEVPEDLDLEDNDYTLNVQVTNRNGVVVEKQYTLHVKEAKHAIDIMDVILTPGNEIKAGNLLLAKVRLENTGYEMQEDIKVELSIPLLGLSTRTWLDELEPYGKDDDSMNANTLALRLPKNMETGDYTLQVKVTFDRGREEVTQEELIRVNGVSVSNKDDTSLVSFDNVVKESKEETAFRVQIVNLGSETKAYSLEVADGRTSGILVLDENEAGELFVYLTPKDGVNEWSVKVKAGEATVTTQTLKVENTSKVNTDFWLIIGAILMILAVIAVVALVKHQENKEYPRF